MRFSRRYDERYQEKGGVSSSRSLRGQMGMFHLVWADLKAKTPGDLVDALLDSYVEIKHNYYLGKHEPSELRGGKFVEACYRVLQHLTGVGPVVPLGTPLKDMPSLLRGFEKTTAEDSYRFHIPRILQVMYDVRNKRGVAHLPGEINPNHMDASLVAGSAA
jgi:hypothetical protein